MGDICNWLIDLSNSLQYADSELEAAERAANDILDEARDDRGVGEWEEMGELSSRITQIRSMLAAAVSPSIRASMDGAARDLDEMESRADAASY